MVTDVLKSGRNEVRWRVAVLNEHGEG